MEDLRSKRVLITGGAGFVGANLTRKLLHSGAEVHALVRPSTKLWRIAEVIPKLSLHLVDLTHREELQRTVNNICPEVIFHLAAHHAYLTQQDRWETSQNNIQGTVNLLEAVTPLDYHRFIHFGSSLEYGMRKEPLKESDHREPMAFYGATKAAATLLCLQFARADRRPIVVLRPFSVYGYWEMPTRLIPTAIMAALLNQEIALTAAGYRRDWVFIEDLVEACLLTLRAKKVTGEIINVGSGQQWSNDDVVEMVQGLSGRKVNLRVGEYPARPWDTTNWVADNRKAKRLLGWEPRHTLRSGLEKTIAWFQLHKEAYANRSTQQGE